MRCITVPVEAVLVGSGWHPSLFRAEMEILCKKRPFRFGTRVLVVNSEYEFIHNLNRSATLDECLSPFGLTTDITTLEYVLEGWIKDNNLKLISGKSIAVRWIRIERGFKEVNGQKLAMFCGEILSKMGWKINLETPDVELMIILDGISEHIFWGKRLISKHPRGGWIQRAATERPFFKPISLDPRLARVALNFVINNPAEIICDPMCGTGGVLLEGALLNQSMIGIDLDEEMVLGSKTNLEWLKKTQKNTKSQRVFHGNAVKTAELLKNKEIKIDGLVFDPPYGKNAWKSEDTWDLFSNVLSNTRTADGIKLDSRLVCFLPISPGVQGINEPISGEKDLGTFSTQQLKSKFNETGWDIISMHAIPIHGSLARMLIFAMAN
jgi:putative methyltransferase (TIGR01177 family)